MVLVKILLALYIVQREKLKNFLMKKRLYKKAKIAKRYQAYKDYISTYIVEILNSFNPELQLKDTESVIRIKLNELMIELKGFKFVKTIVLEFQKEEHDDERKYFTSKAETIINESDIDDVLESINNTIISNIQKSLKKSFGWNIDSVVDHTANISKWKPLSGKSYMRLPKELDHTKKVCLIFKILMIINAMNCAWSDIYIL